MMPKIFVLFQLISAGKFDGNSTELVENIALESIIEYKQNPTVCNLFEILYWDEMVK